MAEVSEQRGLAVKHPQGRQHRRTLQQHPETAQQLCLRIVKAEVAHQQAPTRHALGKGLQADQHGIEKCCVATGDKDNIHRAMPL
jgi:hypothetical protein